MNIYNDFDLSKVLYYKIGGKTKVLIDATSKEDILQALDFIDKNNIQKLLVVGLGANLLVNDNYFDGVVLRMLKGNESSFKLLDSQTVEVFAGETLDGLIAQSAERGLAGIEWAGGLPSTIGAAIRGNVGAFGSEMKNVFFKTDVFEVVDGRVNTKTLTLPQMEFSYRNSLIKRNKNLIISSGTFMLKRLGTSGLEKAHQIYFSNVSYRQKNHPLNYPNCGSVFKNIVKKEEVDKIVSIWPDIKPIVDTKWYGKVSMGYIVNRLGFSGFKIGNAQVSEKHNNFIVNLGGAKFSDVASIIEQIKQKFSQTFGFLPETEIEIIY